MGSPHYTQSGYPRPNRRSSSQAMRNEFELIEAGMDEMLEFWINFVHWDCNWSSNNYFYLRSPWGSFTALDANVILLADNSVGQAQVAFRNDLNQFMNSNNYNYWQIPATDLAGTQHFFTFDEGNEDIDYIRFTTNWGDAASNPMPLQVSIRCKRTQ
jgi:hypothetical protein